MYVCVCVCVRINKLNLSEISHVSVFNLSLKREPFLIRLSQAQLETKTNYRVEHYYFFG